MLLTFLTIVSQLFNLGPLHEAGFRGEGMTIAIIDGGFFRANDPNVFPQDHIIGEYDLVREDYLAGNTAIMDTTSMFEVPGDRHGTMCLSTMLYSHPQWIGTAPDAHYILIRSEETSKEDIREVHRLARALHLADSLGADIITISLGYYQFDDTLQNYTYADMDGTSPCALAATEVAKHNRIVCTSAGNEGNKAWHYISTPADALDILSIGAVTKDSIPASFSSWGPSQDGRQKPELAAWGQSTAIFNPSLQDSTGTFVGALVYGNGTSFSTPEVAGMMACLWQAMPDLTAAELRQLVIETASSYATPDAQIGYGIPNASAAYAAYLAKKEPSADMGNIDSNEEQGQLVYKNGQLFIRKAGHIYTLLGVMVH